MRFPAVEGPLSHSLYSMYESFFMCSFQSFKYTQKRERWRINMR